MVNISSVDKPTTRKMYSVAPDELVLQVANGMAKWGYVHTQETIDALTDFLSGKPLVISGYVGTGKSLFFKALSEYTTGVFDCCGKLIHPYKFAVIDAVSAAGESLASLKEFVQLHEKWDLLIDDVGSEFTSSDYGNKYEIVNVILSWRRSARGRTHFTMNLTEDLVNQRYGTRFLDRTHVAALHKLLTPSMRNDNEVPLDTSSSEYFRIFGTWERKDYSA